MLAATCMEGSLAARNIASHRSWRWDSMAAADLCAVWVGERHVTGRCKAHFRYTFTYRMSSRQGLVHKHDAAREPSERLVKELPFSSPTGPPHLARVHLVQALVIHGDIHLLEHFPHVERQAAEGEGRQRSQVALGSLSESDTITWAIRLSDLDPANHLPAPPAQPTCVRRNSSDGRHSLPRPRSQAGGPCPCTG